MPTYEYECDECKNNFDEFQRITDDPLKICQKCSGKLRRIIHGGSTPIFKGKGFFVNDYGKKEAKRKEEEAKEIAKSEPI